MMHAGATSLATHPRRARALEMMLEGRTDSEIGRELGVDRATIWRWRHDPAIAKELRARHKERLEVLDDRMSALAADALEVIAEMMNDAAQPALVRLRAAAEILDRGGWSGGARGRRIRADVSAEVDRFYATIVERCSPEVLDALVKATTEPWTDDPEAKPRRPHVVVTFPELDEEDGRE